MQQHGVHLGHGAPVAAHPVAQHHAGRHHAGERAHGRREAEGKGEHEGHIDAHELRRQPVGGGPVWFEIGDESFGAEDAVQSVVQDPKGITVTLDPDKAAAFGFARTVAVRIGPGCEDAEPALLALRDMLGDRFKP